ncbi:HD-GYP domain-containing protein [Sphingomonas jinjuensis]|nr:HD-GYP domain-containing protein [Sphingomonas jinjuensis]
MTRATTPLRTIHRDQVRLGMFVHALEGPWFSHPFWRGKFLIASPEQLERILASDIDSLVIDESRGLPLLPQPDFQSQVVRRPDRKLKPMAVRLQRPFRQPQATWITTTGLSPEKEKIRRAVQRSARAIESIMSAAAEGNRISANQVAPLVDDISASVEDHPEALVGLTRLRTKDEYTFVHSVSVCALMMTLGRHIGCDDETVRQLGIGGLLHDIGKMAIPDAMLKKSTRLTDDERTLISTHPEQGYRVLQASSDVSQIVLDVTRHHHERVDGTGYPLRLAGDQLTMPMRIAAICDVFDAVTADRPYKRAWTPTDAVTRMWEWEGHFDRALLFAFMRCIGVYPAGLLVRLRSDRLAITLPPRARGAALQVRAFLSAIDRQPCGVTDVAIGNAASDDQVVGEEDPARWGIDNWLIVSEQLLTGSGRWGDRTGSSIAA